MAENTDAVPDCTDAIVSYDGIFKGMYEENLRKLFQDGRTKLASGDWKAGKETFERALKEAEGFPRDKKTLDVMVKELNRYEKYKIKPETEVAQKLNVDEVAERDLERLDESLFGLPQGVFFLYIGVPGKMGSYRLVGRKILSDMWIKSKIPELFCSFVSADMILGVYANERLSDSVITLFYNPLTNGEKLLIMKNIMTENGKDAELVFPYPLMRESTRREWGSPPEGWVVDEAYDAMLAGGEERIRAYSIQFLQEAGLEKPVLYDPACSTGVFLSTLQQAIPGSYTFGQDLSQQMTDFAKVRVDEAHCANALDPKIKLGTADAVYIRFLNSEVIKTCEAEMLLLGLLKTVKDGGFIITFGHTPVLLSSSNFRCLKDFEFRQSVGVSTDKTGIFQYYVVQKKTI